MSELVSDLVTFARYMLRSGGRVVFFLPTVSDEYEEIDIDTMLCEGMEVVANSLQDFGSWGRRVSFCDVAFFSADSFQLITIRKATTKSFPPPTYADRKQSTEGAEAETEIVHVPAHKDFREKYFQGFKRPSDS